MSEHQASRAEHQPGDGKAAEACGCKIEPVAVQEPHALAQGLVTFEIIHCPRCAASGQMLTALEAYQKCWADPPEAEPYTIDATALKAAYRLAEASIAAARGKP